MRCIKCGNDNISTKCLYCGFDFVNSTVKFLFPLNNNINCELETTNTYGSDDELSEVNPIVPSHMHSEFRAGAVTSQEKIRIIPFIVFFAMEILYVMTLLVWFNKTVIASHTGLILISSHLAVFVNAFLGSKLSVLANRKWLAIVSTILSSVVLIGLMVMGLIAAWSDRGLDRVFLIVVVIVIFSLECKFLSFCVNLGE